MKAKLSRTEAREKIEEFFLRNNFSSEEIKKIKRFAMKFNIKLGAYRRKFCKKCLSKLEGKTRVSKHCKAVECRKCLHLNRINLE